jgi:sugar phosphate permease
MNRWNRIIPAAFLMYTIAYIDRTNFALALPSLQKEFGLDSSMAGIAAGIFFLGYVLFQMPGGYLAQVWSAKRFIFWALLIWGIFATLAASPNPISSYSHSDFFWAWGKAVFGLLPLSCCRVGSRQKSAHALTATGSFASQWQ